VRPMDDAALVEAARSGDTSAWAAVYDRYADKLHDHCHRILRDRDEAADALHDAFLAASQHLDQLRDPSRLRPWLYSICRHESLRRARQRSCLELTDEVDEMRSVDVDMERGTHAADLQELVWAAAAGLNERDQALLDLNVRQGLEGQDLADAVGTSLNNSYVMLSRLRDQVERSLGALLIARLGREECEELDAILVGWDGCFSPILRKRVARHIDGCDVCTERKAAVASPLALLAAAPLVPAPAELRSRVLDGIAGGGEPVPISFTNDGFAASEAPVRRRRPWWLAAVAAVVLLLGGLATALAGSGDDVQLAAGSDTTTTTEEVEATTSTTQPILVLPTPTTTTVPEIAPPTTTPEGPTTTEAPVIIPPPPPPTDTTPPVIIGLSSQFPEIRVTSPSCTPGPKQSTITATISDATSAVLRWSGPPLAGSTGMSQSGGIWMATLGPFTEVPDDLTLDYTVEATDQAGNRATRTGTIRLTPCPQ